MVNLYVDAGIIAIAAFISPYRKDRESIRELVGKDRFMEIYIECPVDVCAARDQKGIYEKARAGVIKDFTGISAPYEPPENPALVIRSDQEDAMAASQRVLDLIKEHQII